MLKTKLLIPILLLLVSGSTVFAQDPQFSQFYAVPLYTNPAFAGSTGNVRINAGFRDQYTALQNNFRTVLASVDANVSSLNGGIGVMAMNDVSGDGFLTSNQVSAIYAFHSAINRNVHFRAAVQATVVQKSYDFNKLKFGDQIDDRYGFVYPTAESKAVEQIIFPNFSTGFLVYSSQFFAGAAIHNLTEPNQSFYYRNSSAEQFKLPRRYTAHAGMNIYLTNQRNEQERIVLSPNILFMSQRNYNQLNLGLYLKRQALTTGLWIRQTSKNTDAAIFLIGLKFPKFRIGYTYDLTLSSARTATQGSNELTAAFEFGIKRKERRVFKPIVCPEF